VAESLRELPAARIIDHIADAAARWADADFPPRVRVTAAIEARLGYSTPVVEYALDRLFFGITRAALTAGIAGELGSVAALDGAQPHAGAPAGWARGVERVVIVASDTTIGVALLPALFALCAKCDVTVKDRSDALVRTFFATLAEEHPAFAGSALATAWDGGDDPTEAPLYREAGTVVAFGGDDALAAIRARCGVETRFVPYGHRASIGVLRGPAVAGFDDASAEGIMRDALLYDGEGCLSLHALFAGARGVALEQVTARLARAAERVSIEFPPGARPAERVSAVATYRSLAEFRAASGTGALVRGGDAALIVAPPRDAPPPFLPGVITVIPIDGDDDVAAYVAAQRLPVQALAIDAVDAGALALAARLGAVRVCGSGSLQDPPVAGRHGGLPRIADFVRWIDAG
jgi:hypothetical protein